MKPNLDQKHGWQAKRSLDNELYRNVELEVWEESKNGNVCIVGIAHRLPTKKSLVLCQFVVNGSSVHLTLPSTEGIFFKTLSQSLRSGKSN